MRTFSKFRLSSTVSCTTSSHMRSLLDAFVATHSTNNSRAVRLALLNYADKAGTISVPDIYQPRHPAHPELTPTTINLSIKPESLRNEYEAHAISYGITMSELVLRCMYAHLVIADDQKQDLLLFKT